MNPRAQFPAWKYTVVACALALTLPALASDDPAQPPGPRGARCEIAVVNPVSGFAECVKPRGVPVEPPPVHPAPTPEECRRHADLDLAGCAGEERSPGPSG
jgi:hypothetical protein